MQANHTLNHAQNDELKTWIYMFCGRFRANRSSNIVAFKIFHTTSASSFACLRSQSSILLCVVALIQFLVSYLFYILKKFSAFSTTGHPTEIKSSTKRFHIYCIWDEKNFKYFNDVYTTTMGLQPEETNLQYEKKRLLFRTFCKIRPTNPRHTLRCWNLFENCISSNLQRTRWETPNMPRERLHKYAIKPII